MPLQTAPLMANARPRIILNKCIVIKRSLISGGQLNVVKGTEVAPYNVLGQSNQSRGYSSVHLSKLLNVSPAEASKYLQKSMGATIYKGELLASKSGLLSRKNLLSPTDGIIDQYNIQTGELRLKFLARQVPLTAGVFGIVEEVDPKEGTVLIKTMATVIYGVLGFGHQRGGILDFIGGQTDPIRSSQISASVHQHVLVTGALIFKDALKKAATLGVQGVISGGLNMADYKAMVGSLNISQRLENDVGITVLATEGFGPIPMGEDVYHILRNFDGKFVYIDGDAKQLVLPTDNENSILTLRKISVPKSAQQLPVPEVRLGELEVGSKVRLVYPPIMGAQGVVVGIDNTPSLLESGISTYLVTVETAHQKVKVPFPNVELII